MGDGIRPFAITRNDKSEVESVCTDGNGQWITGMDRIDEEELSNTEAIRHNFIWVMDCGLLAVVFLGSKSVAGHRCVLI